MCICFIIIEVIESKYQADITFVVQFQHLNLQVYQILEILHHLLDLILQFGKYFSQANVMELFKSRRIIESTLLKSADVNDKNILLIDYYANVKNLRNSSGWINDKIDKIDFNIKSNKRTVSLVYFGMI